MTCAPALIALLSLAALGGGRFAAIHAAADTSTQVPDGLAKSIYVDLSLNDKFLAEDAHPALRYLGDEPVEVELVEQESGIYHTVEALPMSVLYATDLGFEVFCYEGDDPDEVSETVYGGSPLTSSFYDYVCIGSYVEGEKAVIEGYGRFCPKTVNPEATYKTQRVWLRNDNQAFYEEDAWGAVAQNAIAYQVNGIYHIQPMPNVVNTKDGKKYYYADIPEAVADVAFLRLSKAKSHDYLIYLDTGFFPLSYGICYFAGTETYESFKKVNLGVVYDADAVMLGMVVESYLTYGKSDANGATESTVSNLFSTWFKYKSASNDDLKKVKIRDYTGYSSNGNSYEGLVKNAEFSVNEKWNTMCSQAGIDPKTGGKRSAFGWFDVSNPIVLVAVVLGAGLVLSFAGMGVALARRKRRME